MSKMKDLFIDITDMYEEGMSVRDIARVLNVSVGFVQKTIDNHFGPDYISESEYQNYKDSFNASRS